MEIPLFSSLSSAFVLLLALLFSFLGRGAFFGCGSRRVRRRKQERGIELLQVAAKEVRDFLEVGLHRIRRLLWRGVGAGGGGPIRCDILFEESRDFLFSICFFCGRSAVFVE